ncbi:MAG: tetratricopeptide repeat protein [Sedimentisphaerales bacterium]
MTAEKKEKYDTTRSSPVIPLSKKRLWLFRIIATVAVPLLFLGGLELILRLFNVGYDTHAFIEHRVNGRTLCFNNLKFGWRFFPHNISRDFPGLVFEAKKPPNTYRIFVLGESAAQGIPDGAYSFGRILEVMLNDRCPETHFEVIVAAMVAINSHAVLEIAKDCAKYDPDLFIVYLGNNEVVGPFGPGTVFSSISPSLSLIRASIAIKSTRIGQMVESILALAKRGSLPTRWNGMAMFLDKQVRYDSPHMKLVYSYLEKNLNDICTVAHQAAAPVIVSTIGCNLKDCPPFASLHKATLVETEKQKWQQLYNQGIAYETAADYNQAIKNYLAAARIDDTFADIHFRLGRCYWQTAEYTDAREHYLKARLYDTLRFRADDRINEIIRSVSQRRAKDGIYLADAVAAIEKNSPHNTPGEELFYEHVHLNFSGNYVLAGAFFERIQNLLPPSVKQKQSPLLSEEQCAEHLAYTGADRYDLLTQIKQLCNDPPFSNQLYHDEFIKKINQQIDLWKTYLKPPLVQEALDRHQAAIKARPDDWELYWRYSVILEMNKNAEYWKTAEIQLQKAIQLCPYNEATNLTLGKNLHRQGKLSQAIEILNRLLDLKPNSALAHYELAKIYQELKDYKQAIRHLSASMSIETVLHPLKFHASLAEMYFLSGNTGKAVKILSSVVKNYPEKDTAQARANLGYYLGTQGNYKRALEESLLAAKIDPNCLKQPKFKEYISFLETKVNTQ